MGKKSKRGGRRTGAGRKPTNPEGQTIMVAVTVPEALVAKLDDIAEAEGWNRSQAVTEAIRALVKRKGR